MFFYRYKVHESPLDKFGCFLYEEAVNGKAKLIATCGGKVKVYKSFDRENKSFVYFMVDHSVLPVTSKDFKRQNPAIMGFCQLDKIPKWKALETSMLYVSPLWRGNGVATNLYDAILKDGAIVISGFSHNPKSRSLWMKLVQNEKYVAWAHDILDLGRTSDIWVENQQYVCSLKLYEDIKKIRRRKKQDIRIIIYNPRYAQ